MYGKVRRKLLGNYERPSTFGVLKHSLVCKACLKTEKEKEKGGNRDVFAYIDYQEIFMFIIFVFKCIMMNA